MPHQPFTFHQWFSDPLTYLAWISYLPSGYKLLIFLIPLSPSLLLHITGGGAFLMRIKPKLHSGTFLRFYLGVLFFPESHGSSHSEVWGQSGLRRISDHSLNCLWQSFNLHGPLAWTKMKTRFAFLAPLGIRNAHWVYNLFFHKVWWTVLMWINSLASWFFYGFQYSILCLTMICLFYPPNVENLLVSFYFSPITDNVAINIFVYIPVFLRQIPKIKGNSSIVNMQY